MKKNNTDRRVMKTKKAIHEALLELLDKKSISEITIIELTREADVNRKTFYNHYTDIYEVMEEIEDNLVEGLDEMLVEYLKKAHATKQEDIYSEQTDNHVDETNSANDISRLVFPFFETMITQLRYNPELLKLVMYFDGHSKLLKKIVKKEKQTLLSYANTEEGELPWIDFFLTFMMEGTLATINLWREMDYPVPDDAIAGFISELFVRISTTGISSTVKN